MKIAMGIDFLDTPEDITAFIKEGADEFFAGFVPPEWYNQYGWEVGLNRRNYGLEDQFTQYEELKGIIDTIHKYDKEIFITFNAHQYVNNQIPLIREIIFNIEEIQPDGYIVADPALMILLREWNIKRPLHLSTGATCFNSEVIHYFNHIADISRVIIPRKMSLKEMEILVKNCQDLEVEFETMVIGYRCFFNDEYCFNWHTGNYSNFCSYIGLRPKNIDKVFPSTWKETLGRILERPQSQFKEGSILDKFLKDTVVNNNYKENISSFPMDKNTSSKKGMHFNLAYQMYQNCGLCAIPSLKKIGISVVKIPVRGEYKKKRKFLQIVHKPKFHMN